jgi:hypothetical protein
VAEALGLADGDADGLGLAPALAEADGDSAADADATADGLALADGAGDERTPLSRTRPRTATMATAAYGAARCSLGSITASDDR